MFVGGAVCNNISVDRSNFFENNQKIVVLDILFGCLQTLDLATLMIRLLMILHTEPPTQTVFQSWTNSKRLWSQEPWIFLQGGKTYVITSNVVIEAQDKSLVKAEASIPLTVELKGEALLVMKFSETSLQNRNQITNRKI